MIASTLLPEFDHEAKTTRSLLERVPEHDASWKPHEKSMSLGNLATHVANLPSWGKLIVTSEQLDINPGGVPLKGHAFESRDELLERFDRNIAETREALAAASDETLRGPWTLLNNGQQMFSMPRVAVLRSFMMNHVIHHRGQLSVYLRMRDVPLPSIYGPTADT